MTEKIRISDWAEKNGFKPMEVTRFLIKEKVEGVNSTQSQLDPEVLEKHKSKFGSKKKVAKKAASKSKKAAAKTVKKTVKKATLKKKKPVKKEVTQLKKGGKEFTVTLRRSETVEEEAKVVAETPKKEAPKLKKDEVVDSKTTDTKPKLAEKPSDEIIAKSDKPKVKTEVVKEKTSKAKKAEVEADTDAKKVKKEKDLKEASADKAEKAKKPEAPRTAPMLAKVSKPNPEVLARIKRTQEQQQAQQKARQATRSASKSGGRGYTGSFGRSATPSGRGPGRPSGAQRPGFGNAMQDAMMGAGFQQAAAAARSGGRPTRGKRGGRNRQQPKEKAREQMDVARQNVSRVMASLSKNPVKKVYRKEATPQKAGEERQVLKTSDFITVGELAGLMEQMPAKVIAKCMEMGLMVTINHRLDFESIQLLADEFGFDAELMEEYEEEILGIETEDEENLKPRSPIVTVMGHVDHGKTSLLDYIRRENVASGESGGITQHIGAYEVNTPHGKVTFLDTPGHEAFSAMRARGTQVTDVIVLVVASDSKVMPQTIECIELAKSSKVPLVVAITKMDLETANPDRIRTELAGHGIEVEQWGGQTSCVEVSARTGLGMDKLLEILALETEVQELRANPDALARGTVVESQLDHGKGAVATVLIQNGTLRVGDVFVCGNQSGRVRAMFDHLGQMREESGPSVPCQVLGFDGTPQAGDDLIVFADERQARNIAENRRMAARERELRFRKRMSLEHVYDKVKTGEFSELNLIVKSDVDGSAEAIASSLEMLSNREVKINIIRKGVGAVNDSDILLASTADAVIIAFHLMPSHAIREMAEQEGIEIKTYRIIYEIIEEIQGVVEGMLKPTTKEELVGEAEIREVFKVPRVGIIAGCMVVDGTVNRDSHVRVYRDGVELGVTHVQSLKHHKDDVSSIKRGMECGIGLKGYDDIKEGDSLIFFKEVEVARTLADVKDDADEIAKSAAKLKGDRPRS
ncbi:MAG: translation initiation factor IF-2 [Fibrobacter sp.]|nr:translation initiation factor IF-2 [Fibrobacter sp.]